MNNYQSETWEWNDPQILKVIEAIEPIHWDQIHKTALVLTAIMANEYDMPITKDSEGNIELLKIHGLEDLANMMVKHFYDGDESNNGQAKQLAFLTTETIKSISLHWEKNRKASYTPIGRRMLCELVKKYPEKSFFGVDN
jgi:hypothetical protein